MASRERGSFLIGLAWGAILGFAALLLPVLWVGGDGTIAFYQSLLPPLQSAWVAAQDNLRGSIIPFLLVLALYLAQLRALSRLLELAEPPLERVVRGEQLLDLCSSLFFGIGVIWTAIGMREALLQGLGNPEQATEGAFAMLQRLVDGGILLALSTTIVGGFGGYLMRSAKAVWLGQALNRVYLDNSEQPAREQLQALARIEAALRPADRAPGLERNNQVGP